MHDHSSKIEARRKDYARNAANFTAIYSLLNSVETNSEFEEYLNNLLYDYKSDHIYELSIVLYKEPVVLKKEEDPVKIEFDLMKELPKDYWILWNIHIIRLGRTICKAPTPDCEACFLKELCPSAGKVTKKRTSKKVNK